MIKLCIGIVSALVVASMLTAGKAIVDVGRMDERITTNKERLERIDDNVQYIRNNM